MTRLVRVGCSLLGLAALAYGGWLVWRLGSAQWLSLATWLAGGVLAHDLVLAPVILLLGVAASRWMPSYARLPVAVAVVCWGSLTLIALPMIGGYGATPSLPSLLDRPYRMTWVVGTGVVLAAVVAVSWLRWRRQRSGS